MKFFEMTFYYTMSKGKFFETERADVTERKTLWLEAQNLDDAFHMVDEMEAAAKKVINFMAKEAKAGRLDYYTDLTISTHENMKSTTLFKFRGRQDWTDDGYRSFICYGDDTSDYEISAADAVQKIMSTYKALVRIPEADASSTSSGAA